MDVSLLPFYEQQIYIHAAIPPADRLVLDGAGPRRTGPDADAAPPHQGRLPAVSRPSYYARARVPASVRCMAPSPTGEAEDELRRWAETNARRDEVVREAAAAGVSIHQIQEITGISRATIIGILARRPKRPLLRLVSSDEPAPQ